MSRKNKNGAGQKHDITLNFRELANIIGLTPKQRLVMSRYMKEKLMNKTIESEVNKI